MWKTVTEKDREDKIKRAREKKKMKSLKLLKNERMSQREKITRRV